MNAYETKLIAAEDILEKAEAMIGYERTESDEIAEVADKITLAYKGMGIF